MFTKEKQSQYYSKTAKCLGNRLRVYKGQFPQYYREFFVNYEYHYSNVTVENSYDCQITNNMYYNQCDQARKKVLFAFLDLER